jgi:cellobiose-specific phosphotransferase system component IIB
VDSFIEAIEESELRAHIRKVDVSVIPPLTGTHGFEIAN